MDPLPAFINQQHDPVIRPRVNETTLQCLVHQPGRVLELLVFTLGLHAPPRANAARRPSPGYCAHRPGVFPIL